MATLNYQEYTTKKNAFFEKHKYDFRVSTSPMDVYGRYCKDYIFEDGASWHEVVSPTFESATTEIKKVKINVEVKMLRTEFYNTDDATSNCYYEKF